MQSIYSYLYIDNNRDRKVRNLHRPTGLRDEEKQLSEKTHEGNMSQQLEEKSCPLKKGKCSRMCLNIRIPITINFPFGANGKLMILVSQSLSRLGVVHFTQNN